MKGEGRKKESTEKKKVNYGEYDGLTSLHRQGKILTLFIHDWIDMLSEEDYWNRLAIEAKELMAEEPSFEPINGDLRRWRGFIIGTGLYEGGVFVFEIEIPREYPFKQPLVRTLTPIFHPNFFKDRVCVGILGPDWTPANNLVDVVETLRFLLSNPNPDDPLNPEAARLMKEDPEAYEKKVRELVEQFAGWDQLASFQ